jgi:hypothetical protein
MEIFLTAVCLLMLVTLYAHYAMFPTFSEILENQENIKSIVYRKSMQIDLIEGTMKCNREDFLSHSVKIENQLNQIRTDLLLHLSELALKSDFSNLVQDAEKIAEIKKREKEERFKNIQKAFGAKSKDSDE